MQCDKTFRHYKGVSSCVRDMGHKGKHFAWVDEYKIRHATWGDTGGSVTSSAPIAYSCDFCGIQSEDESRRAATFEIDPSTEKLCFTCMFWRQQRNVRNENKPELRGNKKYFIADWVAFIIPSFIQKTVYSSSPASFGPFVNKTTGERIERQQMWCQGTIPETYREWFNNDYEGADSSFISNFKGV